MKKKPTFVKVRKTEKHIKALYEILQNRKFNISNKIKPTYQEHKKFVLNNPYRSWFLVEYEGAFVGSIYLLKDNCIGINFVNQNKFLVNKAVKWVLFNNKPLPEIKSIRSPDFHVNISPDNSTMKNILKDFGATLIQVTYKL